MTEDNKPDQPTILNLWQSDSPSRGGGGAGSMFRIHSHLRSRGVNSKILCQYKLTDSEHVETFPVPGRLENWLKKLTTAAGLNDIHRISSKKVRHHPLFKQADIINFHGLHSGFLSYLALPALTRGKSCILTLRDIWALTGHCACNFDCYRWRTGCGSCPYLSTYPPVKRDATHIEWLLKKWSYSRSNLIIIGISRWLAERAKEGILQQFPVYAIPNGVETDLYKPLDREMCRDALGIPQGKRVLMCCSVDLQQHHKGGDLLQKALLDLPESLRKESVLLILGKNGHVLARACGMDGVPLGYISNTRLKAVAYSAADVFVHPTRFEACGNVLLESMSCGTPMVSFEVGGVPEIVKTGKTGYLAKAEDANDFRHGIEQLLTDEQKRHELGANCREIAVTERRVEAEIDQYEELFRRILCGEVTASQESVQTLAAAASQ